MLHFPGMDAPHSSRVGPRFGRVLTILALTLAIALPSQRVQAQNLDICVNEMSDEQIEQNTNRILRELKDHRRSARAWRFGWLSVYAAVAAGAFVIRGSIDGGSGASESDQARRLSYLGAGIGASIAAARLAFYPMPDVWGARRIERMPTETRADRIAQLRYADSVMSRAGFWQKLATGMTSWGISIGWGLGWGGAVTRQFDEPVTALTTFLGAPILGIATILTAPTWAEQWRARYITSTCTGFYVESAEDPLGDDGDFEDEEVEDDWEPPGGWEDDEDDIDGGLDETMDTPAPSEPDTQAMFLPTMGGAQLFVIF